MVGTRTRSKKAGYKASLDEILAAAKLTGLDQVGNVVKAGAAQVGAAFNEVGAAYKNLEVANPLNQLLGISTQPLRAEAKRLKEEAVAQRQISKAALDENAGKSTQLSSKSRIINNYAANQVKANDKIPAIVDKQGAQAISQFRQAMEKDGRFKPEDIESNIAKAQQVVDAKLKEYKDFEVERSQQSILDLAGQTEKNQNEPLDGVNTYKLERNLQQLDKRRGITPSGMDAFKVNPLIETAVRLANPMAQLGASAANLVSGAVDLLPGEQGAGVLNQKAQSAIQRSADRLLEKGINIRPTQAIQEGGDVGTGVQDFVGNSIPFLLAPESQLARGVGASAARRLAPGIGRNILRAGVKEAVSDAPISAVQTLGQLTGQVQRGELTPEQALMRAAPELLGNFATDFASAGALKGAGSLINKGFESLQSPRVSAEPQASFSDTEIAPNSTSGINNIKSPEMEALEESLKDTRESIADRLNSVGGERVLLSDRGQARLKKLEAKEKDLLVALQKYEPNAKETTVKGLDARQKAQMLASQLQARQKEPFPGLEPEALPEQGGNKAGGLDQPQTPQIKPRAGKAVPVDLEGVAGNPAKAAKQAQKSLKEEYSNALNSESALAEKPLRDGLEELGFEIATNKKGEKYAKLGNVTISLKDAPPPYTLSGLKSHIKEKIAKQRASKDLQQGQAQVEGIQSAFLDNAKADEFLSQLDERALFEEAEFVSRIRRAKDADELNKISEEKPDLFTYSEDGTPSKYMKEFELRDEALNKPQSLGTKTAYEADGTKSIRRTLGDYKAVDFQELQRNPAKLNKLSEGRPGITKLDEDEIDRISDLAKEKKTLENTLVDLSEALEKKLAQKGIKPEEYNYKGIQLFPGKAKDTKALNTKGQKVINRYERMLESLGLGQRVAKSETSSLSVQPNIGKSSRAVIGSQNSIDDLAAQIIKAKGDLPGIQKSFNEAKKSFMKDVAPRLDNNGLDHVWKNSKADTSFHISRPRSEFEGEAKDVLTARRKQLEERVDTGREIEGKYGTKLKSADRVNAKGQSVALNTKSKEFKQAYEELGESLDMLDKDLGEGKLDDAVVGEAEESIKNISKRYDLSGVAFAGGAAKLISEDVGAFDLIETALTTLPVGQKLDNFFKNPKLTQLRKAAVDLVFNNPKTIDQELLSYRKAENEKFLKRFNKIEAAKTLYESKLAMREPEVLKQIIDLMEKYKVDDILDNEGKLKPEFENSKAAQRLEEVSDLKREMIEELQDFAEGVSEKLVAARKRLSKAEAQPDSPTAKRLVKDLEKEVFELEQTKLNLKYKAENLQAQFGNSLLEGLQGMAYKTLLMWNPSVAFLNLFDFVNLRASSELSTKKGVASLFETLPIYNDVDKALGSVVSGALHRNQNSIINYLGAGKRGSAYNIMSDATLARKEGKSPVSWLMGKIGEGIANSDPNKLIADIYQDTAAVASANAWKAQHPEYKGLPDPVTNFKDFLAKAPREAQISLMTKFNTDMGLMVGTGAKGANVSLQGIADNPAGKVLVTLMKPVYRVSNLLRRGTEDMMQGANAFVKNADGTYRFDASKADSERFYKGLGSTIATLAGLYAVGGSTALVGSTYGAVMNTLVKLFVPEDEREEWAQQFNEYSLANKKLFPGMGERIQLQRRKLGEKDSVVNMIADRFKTLGNPLIGSLAENVTKLILEAAKGNEADPKKIIKSFRKVVPLGQLEGRIEDFFTESEKAIYENDAGAIFPKKIGSVPTKGDLKVFFNTGNEEIYNLKRNNSLNEKLAKSAPTEFEERAVYNKNGRVSRSRKNVLPVFSKEGKARFDKDVQAVLKANPGKTKTEVEARILESAQRKWRKQQEERKEGGVKVDRYKKARPKQFIIREDSSAKSKAARPLGMLEKVDI